jgi:uncharacterized RDD family membrane protein YckC
MSPPVNWYYAANGQQLGPFDEEAFQDLVSRGEIQSTTLVWHSGMSGWKPLSETGSTSTTLTAEPALFCSECGARFPSDEMIQFGAARVCANCKDRFAQKIREGVTQGEVRHYAGFWIRSLARILDSVLLWIFFYVLTLGFGGWSAILRGASSGVFSMMFLLQWVSAASYEILLIARYGATLGKLALGLRVITARGDPLTLGLSAGRYLAQLVSSATLTIGYLMAAFDPEKRSLHDRICNTRVVFK